MENETPTMDQTDGLPYIYLYNYFIIETMLDNMALIRIRMHDAFGGGKAYVTNFHNFYFFICTNLDFIFIFNFNDKLR